MTDHLKRHFIEWATVVTLLLAGAIWTYWPSWKASRTQCDLDFYSTAVRLAPCELSLKEPLLDRLDAIEDQVSKGRLPGYARWQRHDTAIRELLKQGLRHDTARLIERELKRIEQHDLGDEK